jgi:hypothetical protein
MTEWTQYQHKGVIEARKWTDADMRAYANRESGISVSGADMESAIYQPPTGYVARNPDNHADQWYIAPEYFAKHYGAPSPVSALVEPKVPQICPYCNEPHGVQFKETT